MTTPVYPAAASGGGLIVIGLVTLGTGLANEYAAWIALRATAAIASAWVKIYLSWCAVRVLWPLLSHAADFKIFATQIAVAASCW